MDTGTIQTFDPSSDSDSFRAALGCFTTGVTVITTDSAEGPVAIVANSFASVSLDPPLVLWSPAKSSKRFEHFVRRGIISNHQAICSEERSTC